MSNDQHHHLPNLDEAKVYEIKVRGHLDSHWTDWLGDQFEAQEQGDCTLLIGPVVDQPALHGLLKKVRDRGVSLVSVVCLDNGSPKSRQKNEHQH